MKPKILIVDDEKPLRDTLARWFRPSYDCITAPDAEEAMKQVEANSDLALMITDVQQNAGTEHARTSNKTNNLFIIYFPSSFYSLVSVIPGLTGNLSTKLYQDPE